MTDASSQLAETATYCRPNDPKRPSLVGLPDATTSQICPADGGPVDELTNAYPDGWYVRIMFDELLDPSVETLTEILDDKGMGTDTYTGSIADTHPVTLQCQSATGTGMVNVDYDGYYSPAGNAVTWPLGPSLVIKPNDPTLIATGRECQLTINGTVTDKDGNPVPADEVGPYKFKTAEITPIATDPTDSLDTTMPAEVDALGPFFDNFYLQFNTDVQVSSFCTDADFGGTFANSFLDADAGSALCDEGTEKFQITPAVSAADAGGGWGYCNVTGDACDTAADCTDAADTHCDSSYVYTYSGLSADDEIGIGYTTPLKTETTYTFSLKPGTKLKDRCGAETTIPTPSSDNMFAITFKTNKFDLNKITIATGETANPVKKPALQFSNVVDPTSLDSTEYSLTPTPAAFAIGQVTGGDIVFGGNYAPDTSYTLTIHAGATVKDAYGATYTNAAEQTVTWKTAAKPLLTTSTADNTTVTKIANQQLVGVSLNFNSNMDVTTLDPSEFTFVNKAGASVTTMPGWTTPLGGVVVGSGGASANCSTKSNACQFRIRADLAPDDYTFTLKAGATISDKLGNVYTQASDLVIHITVEAPAAPVQCL